MMAETPPPVMGVCFEFSPMTVQRAKHGRIAFLLGYRGSVGSNPTCTINAS
jgi:hypothetical protein